MRIVLSTFCILLASTLSYAADITWVSFHDTDGPSTAAGDAGLTAASDIGYTDLLSANGHNVTRMLTREPLTDADIDMMNASDLVIIGRAVSSGHYDPPTDWNTRVTSPAIAMSGYILRSNRLNLTDGTTMVDTVDPLTLLANDPSHPVFAGVALDADNNVASIGNVVTENGVVQRGISINTAGLVGGSLIASSTEAATAGGPVIAEWAAGATLNNGDVLAGDRMIFISGSREADGVTSETAGYYDLTPVGETLFLNSVNHLTVVPEPSTGLMGLIVLLVASCVRKGRRQ